MKRPSLQVRCALYTRKSVTEGLDQEFNSLHAQREAGEAYVASQKHQGWVNLPDHYDDGGFTGGNMARPALKRLIADIEAGKVDCVVVYKIDRLSRSLLDFARLMELFERRKVSFVSVTQSFDTGTSMGRLMLNVLTSFAQFEREIISERTRDKIAATRRKGKWTGGPPVLGYDLDRDAQRLVVNRAEAERVRTIFALYLEHGSFMPVLEELARRGWVNKRHLTKKEVHRGGKPFCRPSLYRVLANPLYAGKVRYRDELFAGEHEAIVDAKTWNRVQQTLRRNGEAKGNRHGNSGALLKGLLRCKSCNRAMTPAHSTKGGRRYSYYACTGAQKKGWASCPSKSVPAQAIESFVLGRIRSIGQNPEVLHETLAQTRAIQESRSVELQKEMRAIARDLARWHEEVRDLASEPASGSSAGRLADLHERIAQAERQQAELHREAERLASSQVDDAEIAQALRQFDPAWECLTPKERARLVDLLIERIEYDGAATKVAITFHPDALRLLADELEALEMSA